MIKITYKIESPENLSIKDIEAFLELLVLQNRVQYPSKEKIYRCKRLGLAMSGHDIVAIAAIKPKTNSDFLPTKADLENISDKFKWELGYCYTAINHTRRGHCSRLVEHLLNDVRSENLIATTETSPNNSMVGILERNGFSQVGKKWLSQIHDGELSLYSRIIN